MSDAFDAVAYLASKGFQGKQANGPEIAYPCFFECGETAQSRKRKLYYNTETDVYVCFVCGASGGSYLLQKHFGDTPDKPQPGSDPNTRRKILNWAAEVGSAWLYNNDPAMIDLLENRGLSIETIVERKIGIVVPPWSLTGSLPEEFTRAELVNTGLVWKEGKRAGQDYFYNHLLIPYVQRGNVVGVRGRAVSGQGAKYLTGQGDVTRLFNVDSLDGAEDVILTEGEFDAIALYQHLSTAPDDRARRMAVIGLSGVNGFPDGADSYFANIRRLYVGFDPDDAGRRAAAGLKERFGARVRIVELPSELPKCDWTEFLLPVDPKATDEWKAEHPHAGHTWQDVLALLGNAAGKRIFSVREAGFSYRQYKAENAKGIGTGYWNIDSLLDPCLLPGQVMIVLAKTGTGKTIFLCNLAWNQRDYNILFISLEMTREEVYDRLRRIAHFYNPRWSEAQIEAALANVYICDENRLSERDIESLIDEFEIETGRKCDLVYIDYLGYFARGASGSSQYDKNTNAVMALKAIAKGKSVAVVAPAQVNRGADAGKPIEIDDARDSGAIEETADFLLALWRPDDVINPEAEGSDLKPLEKAPTGRVQGHILKSRHGNTGRRFGLYLDLLTLVMVGDDQPTDVQRVQRHNKEGFGGLTYEELRRRETAPIQSNLSFT